MSVNSIELVILRHGEACHASSDKERRLTECGQQQISSQYQWLTEQGFIPELILYSPYQRTVETASLSKPFFSDTVFQEEPLITPDGDPPMVASLITDLGKKKILIASHMPMVSYLTAQFLPELGIFSYPVAGLCWLKINSENLPAELIHKRWSTI
ncbi:MAG: hypothetical protein GY829_00990 [Gammaproteobacteria bacterium]|nr:hypothetical protein [Gammaproteobacteria bacterium]